MNSPEETGSGAVFTLSPRTSGPKVAMPWLPTLFQHPFADRILTEFDAHAYLRANPDVAAVALDEAAALRHFYYRGYYERRIFEPSRMRGFNPGFYRERYPELNLASDAEAQTHYCYLGYYEGRAQSREAAWYVDADLHVFQMGKVGSHSIAQGLEASGRKRGAVHLHWVSDFHHSHRSLRVPYRQLLLRRRDRSLQVLSGTREILSWGLASLFQSFGGQFDSPEAALPLVEERIVETCEAGLTWFDHQYFCGLDVYSHPFDPEVGAVRIRHAPLDLMVYRLEDLSRLDDVFAEFLGVPGFRVGRANVGESKSYSETYRAIARLARFPGNLVARLYDRPFMRHFYSDAEREKAYARWVG